jgi:hypothetical protein|nr:MAG TPA: hypothetical protein [Caudoviricetes sp.]
MESNSIFSDEELQIRVILTRILDSATNIVNELTASHPELLAEHGEQLMSTVDHTRNIGKHNAEIIFNDPNQIVYFKCKGNSNYVYGIPENSMDIDKHLYAHEFTCFECHDKNCCPEAFNLQSLFGSCVLGKKMQ